MKMKKAGRVHFFEPEILASAGVAVQGFSTRHEGVSRPPYNSLNLGINTLDSSHNVMGNQSILARAMGGRVESMVTVNQVHGTDLLIIDSPNNDFSHFRKLDCDGIITDQPGVLIGVCVADCVPILLLDPVKRVAAALHAGWKGTAGRIAAKGVEALVDVFGSKRGDIRAAIGPAIGSCCYEVDGVVKDAFAAGGAPEWHAVANPRSDGKWSLDLGKATRLQLVEAGVAEKHIATAEQCVSCSQELFFSYRRDQGETGRQMGFIMLKK